MMPLLPSIALAYLVGRRRQSVTSVLGVAVGVGFFIAVAGMMQGFQGDFIRRIVDSGAHVVVQDRFRTPPLQPVHIASPNAVVELLSLRPRDERRGILGGDRIARELAAWSGVEVSASLSGQAIFRYGGREIAATLVGMVPEAEEKVASFSKDLVAGRLESLTTQSGGVILGRGLAEQLGARMGAKITAISPAGVVSVMKVVGLRKTGITSIDYSQSWVRLKTAQTLLERDNRINQIRLRLLDISQSRPLAARIEAEYGWRTESWEESNAEVFNLFRVQNTIMYSVVAAIMMVAGFGIYTIISTIVQEKARDIAILKSIGFSARDIARVFLMQGVLVGLVGAVLGMGLGWLLATAMEQIPMNMGNKGVVQADHLMVEKSPLVFLLAFSLGVGAAALAAFLPARRAAAMHPVAIIRGAG